MPFLTFGTRKTLMTKRNTRKVPAPQNNSLFSGAMGFGPKSSAARRMVEMSMFRADFDQANLSRMKATKPISASASVNATPRNMVVRTIPAASG